VSLGPPELLLILVIVLILFGAGKLPQVFGSLGKGIKEFREASEGKDTTTTTTATTTTTTTPPTATTVSQTPTAPQDTSSTNQ